MLLEALVERARATALPSGYEKKTVEWVLRIAEDGRFLGLDKLDESREVVAPKLTVQRTILVKANTVVDDFIYVLGAGAPGRDAEWVAVRNDDYRKVLEGIDHPAARAVLAFLDHPDRPLIVPLGAKLTDAQFAVVRAAEPVETSDVPALVTRGTLSTDPKTLGAYRCAVVNAEMYHPNPAGVEVIPCEASSKALLLVEVENHPDWWNAPEVASAHRARMASDNEGGGKVLNDVAGWACSLCGERKPLARVFPKSSRLSAALVSFNSPAWSGYGLSQGHNAPTCSDCAEGIALGLDDLATKDGFRRQVGENVHLLWWSSDPTAPGPWPLLDAAIDPASTDAQREAALAQVTDGHFASIEKFMGRLAVRRHAPVDAETVRRAVRAWNTSCTPHLNVEKTPPAWLMACALGDKPTDPERDRSIETIYLALVAGEPVPQKVSGPVRRLLAKDPLALNTHTNVRRAAFLMFAGVPLDTETRMSTTPQNDTDPLPDEEKMSPGEQAAFNLGRAFSRLDRLQHMRGRTQRSIRLTRLEQVLRTPSRTMSELVDTYGQLRRPTGGTTTDRLTDAFYKTALSLGIPDRLDTKQKNAFRLGVYRQDDIHRASSAARKAEREND